MRTTACLSRGARAATRLAIVVITDRDELGARARCLAAAVRLRKPIDDKRLVAAIDAAIEAAT
jgi:hypothetical protein